MIWWKTEPVYLFAFPRDLFRNFPQARAQLQFQAEQLRRLSSPFLLNLLAAGEAEDLFFFVEEHPRGESLAQIIPGEERKEPALFRPGGAGPVLAALPGAGGRATIDRSRVPASPGYLHRAVA